MTRNIRRKRTHRVSRRKSKRVKRRNISRRRKISRRRNISRKRYKILVGGNDPIKEGHVSVQYEGKGKFVRVYLKIYDDKLVFLRPGSLQNSWKPGKEMHTDLLAGLQRLSSGDWVGPIVISKPISGIDTWWSRKDHPHIIRVHVKGGKYKKYIISVNDQESLREWWDAFLEPGQRQRASADLAEEMQRVAPSAEFMTEDDWTTINSALPNAYMGGGSY